MIEQVRKLVQDKTELFLLYEEETKKLVTENPEDVDQIAEAVASRDDLIQQINAIDARMEEIRRRSEEGTRLYQIVKNQLDYGSLNPQERQLFDESQVIYTVINRIRETEERAEVNMKQILAFLQEKIRQSNVNTKFTGYLKQMEQGTKGMLYDKKR